MNELSNTEQRRRPDRTSRATSVLDLLRFRGRRIAVRRLQERACVFLVDRFDTLTLIMVVSLLALSIADGVLTIELLDMNSEELNPFMGHLLDRGHLTFMLGKYVLTAAGLPLIVVYKNYPLFGTRFRTGMVLPLFISLYLLLIPYQWMLATTGHIRPKPEVLSDRTSKVDVPYRLPRNRQLDNSQTGPMP